MSEFGRSANIRRMILEKPDITLEELISQYKEKFGEIIPEEKPFLLYQERSVLKKKLGNLEKLPQFNKRFNISGFIRKFCTGMTEEQVVKFCGYFAIEVSKDLYRTAMSTIPKTEDFEPDANQSSGPRSRKKRKSSRKIGTETTASVKSNVTYETIEDELDSLIQRSSNLDAKLIQTLKNARRQVGVIILGTH